LASDEDEDIDDVDEELARIEEQLQELDRKASPEAPDPEPEDVDAPAPEEAFEGEPDVDEDDGRLSRLFDRFRADDEPTDETSGDADEGDGGGLGFFSDDEDEDTDPDETDDSPTDEASAADTDTVPDEDGSRQTEDPVVDDDPRGDASEEPVDEPDEEPGSADEIDEADDTETEEGDADDDGGFLGGLTSRFASDGEPEDEQAEVEDAEADGTDAEDEADDGSTGPFGLLSGSDGENEDEETERDEPAENPEPSDDADEDDEATVAPAAATAGDAEDDPTDDGADPPEEPATAASEDEEDEKPRASALLARFQGGSGDPDDPAAEDEEDDDGGGILVPALIAILLLAGLAAGAYFLVPGSSTGDDLDAALVADSFTDDGGSYVATTGEPITLDATASTGTIDSYVWSFGDGSEETTSEPTVEHTYEERGTYTVELAVENGDGQAETTIEVTVVDPPSAEASALLGGDAVAEPGTVGNNVFVGDGLTLDASASSADPDRSLSGYEWDVGGDGETDANGPNVEVTLDEVGRWTPTLTVRDDLGNEDTTSLPVHVSDRRTLEDTLGPSSTDADTDSYPLQVDLGRQQARPIQLGLELTYNASGNDTGDVPVQPMVEPDLDLNVTDPQGTVFQADDDEGEGAESLTVAGEDLANLGEWNVTVAQDSQNAGTASEAEYELTIRRLY